MNTASEDFNADFDPGDPSGSSIVDTSKLTEEELNAELEKGYADYLADRAQPAEEVYAEMRRDYNI